MSLNDDWIDSRFVYQLVPVQIGLDALKMICEQRYQYASHAKQSFPSDDSLYSAEEIEKFKLESEKINSYKKNEIGPKEVREIVEFIGGEENLGALVMASMVHPIDRKYGIGQLFLRGLKQNGTEQFPYFLPKECDKIMALANTR